MAKANPLNPTAVTKIMPIAICGNNMDSSNERIALPDSAYDFKQNKQGIKGKGLLLANIRLTTTTPTDKTKYL